MTPLTYPARPTKGGNSWPSWSHHWAFEPKYNGWRALVHVPSGQMWNRHLEELSIVDEFAEALEQLKFYYRQFTFLDVEALERRHGIGKGALIILDCIEPGTFKERRDRISRCEMLAIDGRPADHSIYLPSHEEQLPERLWQKLQERNKDLGCEFYEGIVAKRWDSNYNIQLTSPDQTTSAWIKHRWPW